MTKSNKDLISNITSLITLILMAICGVLLMIAIGHILSELMVLNEQHVIINMVVKNSFSESVWMDAWYGAATGFIIYELLPTRFK